MRGSGAFGGAWELASRGQGDGAGWTAEWSWEEGWISESGGNRPESRQRLARNPTRIQRARCLLREFLLLYVNPA